MFIHKSVRLNCDLTMAYRYFVVDKLLAKWLSESSEVDLKKAVYNIKCSEIDFTGTTVKDFNREEILFLELVSDRFDEKSKPKALEINFMKCTSKTEFCTEIHLVHKGFEDKDKDDYIFYDNFWTDAFEKLRYVHNKDWFISDKELTLGILQGSRL